MTLKHNLLTELYGDIAEAGLFAPVLLIQIACALAALGLAYVAVRAWRQRISKPDASHLGGVSLAWVAFPLFAYLLCGLASAILAGWMSRTLKVLDLAELLLLAMFSIRILVYLMRHVFTGAWLARWERIIAAVLWLVYALQVVGVLPELAKALDAVSFHVGKVHISLLGIVQALASVGLTLLAALWLGRVIERRLLATDLIDLNVRVVLNKVIRAGLLVLAVMIALPLVGIDLTVLSVFGGALGVGLGFGLQKIASNYVSGFIILLDRSVKLGDLVMIEGRQGTIAELTSRYIVLKMLDGTDVLIPNETLVTSTVVNLSYKDRKVVLGVPIQVAYDTNLDQAMALMLAATEGEARLANDPAPGVFVRGFADSGINLELTVWVLDPENGTGALRSDLNRKIWQAFQAHRIGIPFPQREVRIVSTVNPLV